ncbi:M23 family metallopeptidase [Paenibacillus sp. R14(2021)]|uniref:M23 family metallopeptidase n=1 Tax=Paenibacillus sp. R14(2021) TaxID=2859228 RepID=UPI001C616955|nr:M23 family metallopeptidase [Paenibacillus sp. R14(2021)]
MLVRSMLICLIAICVAAVTGFPHPNAMAAGQAGTVTVKAKYETKKAPLQELSYAKRKVLYDEISVVTGIPWYRLAAVDQYERTITRARPKTRAQLGQYISVFVTESEWAGELNPDAKDQFPLSIHWFNGLGEDGDGDGLAVRTNDIDLLYSFANHLMQFGTKDDDFSIALWQYYHNTRAVQRIRQFARLYETYGKLNLFEHAFPVPIGTNYSYKGTWGTGRSWGGYRIHEGTDIFANHGVPARSTCYGIIEVKGWNPYGGWRLGIRDLNNYYHYYAHLSGYDKTIDVGTVVKPGQVIGWVGSSGYGRPGTQGKFPPHLHYGIYRDRGLVEWSFDPYPSLRQWEIDERRRLRGRKS